MLSFYTPIRKKLHSEASFSMQLVACYIYYFLVL